LIVGVLMKSAFAIESDEQNVLDLDVISYESFIQDDPEALSVLKQALYEKGIVGIKGIPGYAEKVSHFIQTAREFVALPEEVKASYSPRHDLGETFLGYERGKEKFRRQDCRWVVDDLKISFYAQVPDFAGNKWPREVDLKTAFQDIGALMNEMGEAVMSKIDLLGHETGIFMKDGTRFGRLLHYQKTGHTDRDNPLWCGGHFDHGLFTALLPAFYFVDGTTVSEPVDAGLFVKTTSEGVFKKVVCDPDVLMFQVGEFGQLVTNDVIKATEHRVNKSSLNDIERFTMALFFDPPMDTVIRSFSILTKDSRYGGGPGDPCSYGHWHEESFKRYIVEEEE